MLKLRGNIEGLGQAAPSGLFTVTTDASLPGAVRGRFALLTRKFDDKTGFGAQLIRGDSEVPGYAVGVYRLPDHFDYLMSGDIVYIDARHQFLSTLFRKNAHHNTLLLTERCNHYCLMCSQPPKEADDSFLMRRAFDLIELIPKEAKSISFSGGEPTLYGEELIKLVAHAKRHLPNTSLDVLSNGRRFKHKDFARQFAEIRHPDCLVGIPIYSDDPVRHDYVVQAHGAFDETIRGILNLKRFGQKVEVRIVLHRQTIDRLVDACKFICRNLLFVDHVALMGLEITGFTRPNLDTLWIDPFDYRDKLSEAVTLLNAYGMTASVYNHQLCVVNRDVEGNYRKSISDWKNEYLDVCNACSRKSECGGFFSSSKLYKHSQHIAPFQ